MHQYYDTETTDLNVSNTRETVLRREQHAGKTVGNEDISTAKREQHEGS